MFRHSLAKPRFGHHFGVRFQLFLPNEGLYINIFVVCELQWAVTGTVIVSTALGVSAGRFFIELTPGPWCLVVKSRRLLWGIILGVLVFFLVFINQNGMGVEADQVCR